MTNVINYNALVWMQEVTDVDGNIFYNLGPLADHEGTLAVTPKGGNGATRFFCKTHRRAYFIRETCPDCRNAVRNDDLEGSVTTCDTPEFQR